MVKSMMGKLGYEILVVDRVECARITKKDLPIAHYRHLTEKEVLFLKMSYMKYLFILTIGVIILSTCNTSEDKGNASVDYAEYFYPTDSIIPFIYLFQEENNPLNEKMHRIYRLESADEIGRASCRERVEKSDVDV